MLGMVWLGGVNLVAIQSSFHDEGTYTLGLLLLVLFVFLVQILLRHVLDVLGLANVRCRAHWLQTAVIITQVQIQRTSWWCEPLTHVLPYQEPQDGQSIKYIVAE
jgi:hypothetical protein